MKPNQEKEEDLEREEAGVAKEEEDAEELNKKLLANNQELLDVIELDKTLKLNVAQELPCEAFQLQYESYRTKDTSFCVDCDLTLRREEYAEHYSLFHNYLLSSAEQIDACCPLQEYGCGYHKQTVEFFYGPSVSKGKTCGAF